MAVSEAAFWTIVIAGGGVLSTLGGAVYLNRRKVNRLYQRLFGMEADPHDGGAIDEFNDRIENIRTDMNEQHREVQQVLEEIKNGQ